MIRIQNLLEVWSWPLVEEILDDVSDQEYGVGSMSSQQIDSYVSPTTTLCQKDRRSNERSTFVMFLTTMALTLVVVGGLAVGCGLSNSPSSGELREYELKFVPESLVGMPEMVATDLAQREGWVVRVVRRDGERMVVTQDFVSNRVNLEIDGGTVTAVSVG